MYCKHMDALKFIILFLLGIRANANAICNTDISIDSYLNEIGDESVQYCKQSREFNGYPVYVAETSSGDAEMFYIKNMNLIIDGEIDTNLNGTYSGYVIYYSDDYKAYCLNETDPIKCSNKWMTQNFDGEFYQDTNMITSECNCEPSITLVSFGGASSYICTKQERKKWQQMRMG